MIMNLRFQKIEGHKREWVYTKTPKHTSKKEVSKLLVHCSVKVQAAAVCPP
jgi:hypothetical protein